jgi:hypothetical protein
MPEEDDGTGTRRCEATAMKLSWVLGAVALLVLLVWCTGVGGEAEPEPATFTDEQITVAANTWLQGVGLLQTDSQVWSERLDQVCASDIHSDPAASALAAEFIAEDLETQSPTDGTPPISSGVTALRQMSLPICGR